MGTTGVSQVFNSLKINTRYISYDSISALAQALELNTWKTATSDDKSLACILCRSIITNFYKEKDKEVMDKLYRLPLKLKHILTRNILCIAGLKGSGKDESAKMLQFV